MGVPVISVSEPVDTGVLAVEILELGRRPDFVAGELLELADREIPSPGIADQHVKTAIAGRTEPSSHARREPGLIPAVARQDEVRGGWLLVEDVTRDGGQADVIRTRVDVHRG